MSRRPARPERGMITAETATIAPFGVLLALLLAWLVSLGLTQVRLVDAAREGARLVARGESSAVALAVVRRNAPPGARVSIRSVDGEVVVRVRARSRLPVPLAGGLGARELSAVAVAADEDPP